MLLRSAPREVYRVYGEEDYLACRDLIEGAPPTVAVAPDSDLQRLERSRRAPTPHRVPIAPAVALACGLLGVLLGLRLRSGDGAPAPTTSGLAGRAPSRPPTLSTFAHAPARAAANSPAGARPASRGHAAVRRPVRAHAIDSRVRGLDGKSTAWAGAVQSARVALARGGPPAAAPSVQAIGASRRAASAEAEFGFER